MESTTLDTHQSVYREHLIEHLLIGELLKHSWLHQGADLEISRPELDRAGVDIILEANRITRHVQLKSSFRGARTADQKVHVGLAGKPSGCVIWVRFDPDAYSDESVHRIRCMPASGSKGAVSPGGDD